MIEPNESAVTVFRVEIGPIVRKDVRVQIDLHLRASCQTPYLGRSYSESPAILHLKTVYWLGLRDLVPALLARAPRIVVPEIEHRLAEMLHDVAAIEVDVFH